MDTFEWMENEPRSINFDDLVFKPHPYNFNGMDRVQATGNFPNNGKWYSVVGGCGMWGDGITTFEVWADGLEEPIGWLTEEDINKLFEQLQHGYKD